LRRWNKQGGKAWRWLNNNKLQGRKKEASKGSSSLVLVHREKLDFEKLRLKWVKAFNIEKEKGRGLKGRRNVLEE